MFLTYHLRHQFWILYYKVLNESDKCQTTNDHMKSLTAAKIREIQTLYCSGLDLERPLMLSLSPCSDKHKQEVITCINDFAMTFSSDFSEPSLCRYSMSARYQIHQYDEFLARENDGTEREIQGVGRDVSSPRKLFLTQRKSRFSSGSLFSETSACSLASLSGS